MEESQKICLYCRSDKIISEQEIMTIGENLPLHISINKTPKKTGFLNRSAPTVSKIKANICGNCGDIQLIATNPQRLWNTYQISLKNS